MPTARVGDINIYYEVSGEGQPLVLIPGLGADLTDWMFQIPEFSKKYKVVAFDNRGTGRSEAPDAPYSTRMMADDTAGLMDALGIDGAHVLGYSMGGFIAQEFAINYPERTKSLILAATCAAPAAYDDLSQYHVEQAWAAAVAEVSPKTFVRMQLPYLVTSEFFDKPEMVTMWVEAISANPYRTQPYAYRRLSVASLQHDTRTRLKRITAPTLVLVGKEDILLPVKVSEELAALVPRARLVALEGGAHAMWVETPDKFNQAVLHFLAENEYIHETV